jgi:NADPH:quinone reductase-like Zn-dependent oxidoreductase
MEQYMKAVKPEGVISFIGFLGRGGENGQPSTLHALTNMCTVRGLLVGSKAHFMDINRSIKANNIHPVVD